MQGKEIWKALWMPLLLMVAFVLVFFSLSKIYVRSTPAPTLDIISGSEIITSQDEVPITGVVHGSDKVTITGKEVVLSSDGGFSSLVPVKLGENNVEVIAGDKNQTKATIKVTREEETKTVAAKNSTITPAKSDLSTTGPAEAASGSFGLAAIMVSLYIYKKSLRKQVLQRA
jgi:hypothetical protein